MTGPSPIGPSTTSDSQGTSGRWSELFSGRLLATGFLIAAVIASMLVSRVPAGRGASRAHLVGFLVFAVGAAVNAVSPSTEVLIVGRDGVRTVGRRCARA
ncbi:hypothetical protein AB0I60_19685 [Actinosynnema sp. NPDC050436]|uniref:hypothetical protein n=1 Tax=Actinosynnema sp. NPDC050436 TaxID=3155659 RepID=UPI0033C0C47A